MTMPFIASLPEDRLDKGFRGDAAANSSVKGTTKRTSIPVSSMTLFFSSSGVMDGQFLVLPQYVKGMGVKGHEHGGAVYLPGPFLSPSR